MATLLHQHHMMMTRDLYRHAPRPRDVVNDSVLQSLSFDDITDTSQLLDAWMMTLSHDDSGVSLNNDHEWSPAGIPPPDNPNNYDVSAEHVTAGETPTTAWNLCYDVVENVTSPSCVWSTGIPAERRRDDVIKEFPSVSPLRFTDEQIVCICVSLQQQRGIDKLDEFLSTITSGRHATWQPCIASCRSHQITPSSRETCHDDDVFPVTHCGRDTCMLEQIGLQAQSQSADDVLDAVLSSMAHVSFERGRYQQLYDVLESHRFSDVYHSGLQQLWYQGHYAEATAARRRVLGAVDKYRIRRKHPLPTTIWDGQDTVYCFKVGARNLLKESYARCRYPTSDERRRLAHSTGLTVTQVNNWYKNRRQRDHRGLSVDEQPPAIQVNNSYKNQQPQPAAGMTSSHWPTMTSQLGLHSLSQPTTYNSVLCMDASVRGKRPTTRRRISSTPLPSLCDVSTEFTSNLYPATHSTSVTSDPSS